MKVFHDKHILRKSFEPSQKVLLYNSMLHLFSRKLRSRWTGPFIVKNVFPHGAIKTENPKNGNIFKVNGQRLKPFLENFSQEQESINLEDLIYQDLSSNQHQCLCLSLDLFFVFLFCFLTHFAGVNVFFFFLVHLCSSLQGTLHNLYSILFFLVNIEDNVSFRLGGGT